MGCKSSSEKKSESPDEGGAPAKERNDTVRAVAPQPPVEVKEDNYGDAPPPQAKKDTRYQGAGPTMSGTVLPQFKDGLLFRIVDNDKWGFYNDTQDYEMHVSWQFGPESVVKPQGRTTSRHDPSGWWVLELVIYPSETEPFMTGTYNGYKSAVSAKPLSEEYRKKVNAEADARVQAELANVTKLAGGATPADEERVLAACIFQRVPYVDLKFPPVQSSLSRSFDKVQLPPTAFKRPTDYLPPDFRKSIALFRNISVDDIDQGQLGDCWLLCSISSLAEQPSMIKDIFKHPTGVEQALKEQAVGAYRVTLNKNGWWQILILDDYLPVVGNKPLFAKTVEDPSELWVSLIEKAYAKVHGSYASITAGDALHALTDLTGFPVTRFDTEWEDALKNSTADDTLFADLLRYDKEGFLINLNTPGIDNSAYMSAQSSGNSKEFEERYTKAGLGMGHAYSILKVKSFPQLNLRLLQIRNPWGNGTEWTGDWCDTDVKWKQHPDVARDCGFSAAPDGTFWMAWADVKKYFDGGGVCFVRNGWSDYRVKGTFEKGHPSVVLQVTCSKATKAMLVLSQNDRRGKPPEDPDVKYAAALLSVTRGDAADSQSVHLNSTSDADKPSPKYTFNIARDLGLVYDFQPSATPYLVIPRLYHAGMSKSFVLGFLPERCVGDGLVVEFKYLDPFVKVFQNYPKFSYSAAQDSRAVEADFQYNPPIGCPITMRGTCLLNQPAK